MKHDSETTPLITANIYWVCLQVLSYGFSTHWPLRFSQLGQTTQ